MKLLALYGPEEFKQFYDADIYPLYRNLHGIGKKLFKLYEHIHLGGIARWLAGWKDKVAEYDTIMIFDGIRGRDVVEYIRKHNKRARIIIYYVNPMDPTDRKCPVFYQGLGCEFYTFDPRDAAEYNMTFKPFYYSGGANVLTEEQEIIQDIFFVGVDKNRLPMLIKLKEQFDKANLTSNLIVVADKYRNYSTEEKAILSQPVSYEDVIDNVRHSRCVLDIVQEGQSGITLRPMEAMMNDKKLITNNLYIKEYDFYNPENIFILQERNISELADFVRKPVEPVTSDIKENYRFEKWAEGFFRS